mgnify:CR=1 FL=1
MCIAFHFSADCVVVCNVYVCLLVNIDREISVSSFFRICHFKVRSKCYATPSVYCRGIEV